MGIKDPSSVPAAFAQWGVGFRPTKF